MRTILSFIAMYIIFQVTVYAESNIWSKIENFSKLGTPQGNPQLAEYIKSLSPEQMLQAARECCTKAEKNVPIEHWEEGVVPVGLALTFYGDEKGGLTDGALKKLLDIITAKSEGDLLRETLLRLLRQKYWHLMTHQQRKNSRGLFVALLFDTNAPIRIRSFSCKSFEFSVAEEYRKIIRADKNVRSLEKGNKSFEDLYTIARKSDSILEPGTKEALKFLSKEVLSASPKLLTLSKDAKESQELKKVVLDSINNFKKLPVVIEK